MSKNENLFPELDFTPPSKRFAQNFIKPFKNYFSPSFYGIEELDGSRPAMFVSNHAVMGVLDVYPFAIELYLKKGIYMRALADSNHFKIPLWKDFITKRIGVVEASRKNCEKIMLRKENLVVFPGGTREVCKKKGEAYELKWSDRTGFVYMAMKYGYDIIPVAAVGAEDAFTIVKDANDILQHTSFGKFLQLTGLSSSIFKDGELMPPQIKGIGNTIIPRPEKLYFSFGKRISTKRYKNQIDDKEVLEAMKNKVENALKKQFDELFAIRKKDKDINQIRKLFLGK